MNVITDKTTLGLACHPWNTCRAVAAIDAAIAIMEDGGLRLGFVLRGHLSALHIPQPRPSRRVDGLWRHTCFEAFVMADAGPGYREFNFSPSGEWAVYDFRGYRERGAPIAETAPRIEVRGSGDQLALEVELRAECLPRGHDLRLGLSAVVEGSDGALSCWALRHPAGPADFHHADAFALKLEIPAMPEADVHAAEARS
jgi:hypothetical protein